MQVSALIALLALPLLPVLAHLRLVVRVRLVAASVALLLWLLLVSSVAEHIGEAGLESEWDGSRGRRLSRGGGVVHVGGVESGEDGGDVWLAVRAGWSSLLLWLKLRLR